MKKVNQVTPQKNIDISVQAISKVVGDTIISSYGIAGIVAKNSKENEILNIKDFNKGIIVKIDEKTKKYSVDVYILTVYPTKITEVIFEVQKKVKYVLEQTFAVKFREVNVFVEGLSTF